ncbi:hypothetical protein ACLB1G_08075 [Oxalobacteraceae bacterium A2-2]
MAPDDDYERRILAIHGDGGVEDIRHEEFAAMADVYLGADFDKAKLVEIETLQVRLHAEQDALITGLESKSISPEQYVDACNKLIQDFAVRCEQVLGKADFNKLFGIERGEAGVLIDKDIFLAAHG